MSGFMEGDMSDTRNTEWDAGRVAQPEIDEATGQPFEDAEKNLSRHSTADSSPPVAEQERTTTKAPQEDEGEQRRPDSSV